LLNHQSENKDTANEEQLAEMLKKTMGEAQILEAAQ
jgi:hypothetical protein